MAEFADDVRKMPMDIHTLVEEIAALASIISEEIEYSDDNTLALTY